MKNRLFLFAAVLLLTVAAAGEDLKIQVTGQTLEYTVTGGEVRVYGSQNNIVVNGPTSDFDVYGSGNAITINGDSGDLDLYGSQNVIHVNGHLEETDLRGSQNKVYCTSVDDVGFEGADNLVEWEKGVTPDRKDRGVRNQLRRKP